MPRPKRTLQRIPTFRTGDEERDFWAVHDSTEFVDWSKARAVRLPDLQPSSTAISLRLPDTLLTELKRLANERDVPYQSLPKLYLADRVEAERARSRLAGTPPRPRKARRTRAGKPPGR